jgi:hypothetical protein
MDLKQRHVLTDEQIDRARQAGARAAAEEPRAESASYDKLRDAVVVQLRGGTLLVIPRGTIQGLAGADPRDVANVEVCSDGYALSWDALDVDITVPGLAAGFFGTKSWMARLGGQATSAKKAEAARQNGKRGLRPRTSAERTIEVAAKYQDTEIVP